MKDIAAKPSKRKRKSPDARTAPGSGGAKRPAKAATPSRKPAGEEPEQGAKNRERRKASVDRAGACERGGSKIAAREPRRPESRTAVDKAATASCRVKPSLITAFTCAEPAVRPRRNLSQPPVKVQKPGRPEEFRRLRRHRKSAGQRQGFKLNEFVVYPAHGVGQIVAIEEQEVAGFRLELFVISFSKDKLTLRVPTSKVSGVGMRKISDPDTARRSLEILTGRARVKRTMWSRRAQEYETKINSGDINAIAEVVRDLYRSEAQPEQSYSERQLYEAALDRMVREIAAVQKSNEIDALKAVEAQLQKGQNRASKPAGPARRSKRDRTSCLRIRRLSRSQMGSAVLCV